MPTNLSLGSAFDTVMFSGQFQTAFTENNKCLDSMYNYIYMPGTQAARFKVINGSVARHNSGALDGAAGGNTGTAVSVDAILVAHDYIPYSDINQNGDFSTQYARGLGTKLATARQKCLTNFFAKNAADAGRSIEYNNEAADTEALGKTVYGSLLTAASNFVQNGIPEGDRYAALHPELFYALRTYAPAASRDYVPSAASDNTVANIGGVSLLGFTVFPVYGNFGQTGDTNLAAKYQTNFSGTTGPASCMGLIWHKDALAVVESEKPKTVISDSPENQSWLTVARCQFGTGVVQGSGAYALVKDTVA